MVGVKSIFVSFHCFVRYLIAPGATDRVKSILLVVAASADFHILFCFSDGFFVYSSGSGRAMESAVKKACHPNLLDNTTENMVSWALFETSVSFSFSRVQ